MWRVRPNEGRRLRALDTEVNYMTEDVYGPVASGVVRLECYPLRQVVVGEHIVNAMPDEETSLPERKYLPSCWIFQHWV
jgi:hypothetical protein